MLMGTGWRIHTARRTSWRERSAQWFCSFCTPEELQQYLGKYWLHHQKPTWQRKNNHVKMYLLLNMAILHCHVSFLEDNFWLYQCQCPNKGNVKINKGTLLHRGTVATSTVRNAKTINLNSLIIFHPNSWIDTPHFQSFKIYPPGN